MSEEREQPQGVDRRRFMRRVAGGAVFAGSVAGAAEAGAELSAQDVRASDVELVRAAFDALSRGDAEVAVKILDSDVRWQAVATRELTQATTLDRRGAGAYLQRMARSITSGERRLAVRSVSAERGVVRVVSAWSDARGGADCANLIRLVNGKVVSVTEAAQ